MLFSQTMSAARTGFDTFRNLQQLLGQVVTRVTDMIL